MKKSQSFQSVIVRSFRLRSRWSLTISIRFLFQIHFYSIFLLSFCNLSNITMVWWPPGAYLEDADILYPTNILWNLVFSHIVLYILLYVLYHLQTPRISNLTFWRCSSQPRLSCTYWQIELFLLQFLIRTSWLVKEPLIYALQCSEYSIQARYYLCRI